MKTLVLMIAMACLSMQAFTQTFDGSKGNQWYGGRLDFNNSGDDSGGDRISTILISPIMRFFAADQIFIGPRIGYSGAFYGGDGIHIIEVGADFGTLSRKETLFYGMTSPHMTIMSSSDSDAENVFVLPLSIGVMFPLKDIVAIQLETGFGLGIGDGYKTTTFQIGVGICGLGQKTAISFINSRSLY